MAAGVMAYGRVMRIRPVLAALLALVAVGMLAPTASARAHVQVRGTDNVSTAIDWSNLHGGTATTVVLARDDSFADALAGGALAGALGGRFLVTPTRTLAARVVDELEALEAERVVIVGGTAAVSEAVKADLEARGYETERIAGADRIATAIAVAEDSTSDTGLPLYVTPSTAFVARAFGDGTAGFADSLGGGMLAATEGVPLVLTATEALSEETRAYLESVPTLDTIGIIGGTAAVSQAVEDELTEMGFTVERYAGTTRFGTADEVAEASFQNGEDSVVALLDGMHADSWVSGFAAATFPTGAVLLTNDTVIPTETSEALDRMATATAGLTVLYCAPEVSEATCEDADDILNG
jgi:putative cell wall-binding protein